MGQGTVQLSDLETIDEMFNLLPYQRYRRSQTTYLGYGLIEISIRDKYDGSYLKLIEREENMNSHIVTHMNSDHEIYVNLVYNYLVNYIINAYNYDT